MRAPQCPQAWAWLALLGLASVATYHQTGVDAAPPNNNRQKAKLHFLCKEGEVCLVWPMRNSPSLISDGIIQFLNGTECGVVPLKPSALQQAQMKSLQLASEALGFFCKKITFIRPTKKKRLKRQSGSRRGKYRGQTQSQYLNIGGHDNGKAEALSDADSSRALVSGKSGMGQAQSQSVYDPSCEECFGGVSETGTENIRHSSGPRIALNNNGRFPAPGYSNRPVNSDTGRPINPTSIQRPGSGPSSNNENYGSTGGQNPLGTSNSYQPLWSPQQLSGSILPGKNYEIPNQGSFNTGIPSSNGQPDQLGGSQTPTQQQGNGFVNSQVVPEPINVPNLDIQKPMNGQIPNNGPMAINGDVPNNGLINRNGQIPNNGIMDRNGQVPNNGPIDRNGQIPYSEQNDRNGQIPNNGPIGTSGHIPYNVATDGNGQIPINGPMYRNGQIPSNGPIYWNEQTPNNGPMDRNGQIPNNGPIDRNGQVPNNGLIDRNGQIPNSRPIDRNGQIPNNGPLGRISNAFVQRYPESSSKPSQSNQDGFVQTPALYPNQSPSTSYANNLGQSLFPGQMSSQPATTGNGGNVIPLGNKQHPQTSFFPGQTLPSQGSIQTQDRNYFPIPYGTAPTSLIGPNGETYLCCVVAPNKNGPTRGQPQPQLPAQSPGTKGQPNYSTAISPELNSQYDSTGSPGSRNALVGQDTVGPNYQNNQPVSTYGIRGQGANAPLGGGNRHSSPHGDQMIPIDGSASQGNPQYTSGRQNTYPSTTGMLNYSGDGGQTFPVIGSNPQGSSIYNTNQGPRYYSTGQNPTPQTVGRDTQGPAFNYPYQNPNDAFTNGVKQSPYDLRGQEQSGTQGPSYYNGGQGLNNYPIGNQNNPYDSQRQDQIHSLGSTPYYDNRQVQNTPLTGSGGQNLPYDSNSRDQISSIPTVGVSGGPRYSKQGQSVPPFNVNGQGIPYPTNGGQNIVTANNIPFANEPGQGQSAQRPSFAQDVTGNLGYHYGVTNGVSPEGATYISGTQILPNQSTTGGARFDRPWNNGSPLGTGSGNQGPGQAQGQTGSHQGGQGQTYPNGVGANYPQPGQHGSMGQSPTQEQGRNGKHGPISSDRNTQSPGSYVNGQEFTPHDAGVIRGNLPEGQDQPVGSTFNAPVPGNQNPPVFPLGNPNNFYPGSQSTGLSNEHGSYNEIKGTNKDVTSPGFTQSSLNGMPPNELEPTSITSEKDESEAQASITHDFNGTMAIASSKGGNEKGKANTQVQGSYTGSGSFSAQAQITDEEKGAESQVSGGKEGATSNALGKGKNNKSQANVQLGSETGSLQTQSQSESKHHSTNSQVQGGVKGGMADAQARGPGSTSSQAQIGFTPYKDGDKAHEILKTPFVGIGSANAQSNGKTGQSQSQLQGTFKYGISYSGAAQSGASIDKDTVFENRMPYKKVDVFEGEKNIQVDTDIPLPPPKLDKDDNAANNNHNHELGHPHADHHKMDEQMKNTTPSITRSFDSHANNDKEKDYEFDSNRDEISTDDYESEGAAPPDYYDEFPREQDTGNQHVNAASRRNIDIQQTSRGNTQHILLGNIQGQNAEIEQKSSEHEPDYRRIYQPGERVPGTGGYIIPAGFTGSIQAISSRDKTIALGSRESPSQAQTVTLTPGNGQINYITNKPAEYGKSVNSNQLKSLNNNKPDDNRYMTVSKSVSGALDEENKIKKEYSHTYYTKSSSCGYFTFTCTMVRGTNGTKKVCKPKIPTNPDGTPLKC